MIQQFMEKFCYEKNENPDNFVHFSNTSSKKNTPSAIKAVKTP